MALTCQRGGVFLYAPMYEFLPVSFLLHSQPSMDDFLHGMVSYLRTGTVSYLSFYLLSGTELDLQEVPST